ncbi:MAG: hypothetical protein EOO16_11510 [Chitinophagaceae bacterium]|nr:MAG: hypothetical protein EOO16_11510 [Chitinophagaceae bacterium]
MPTLTDTGHGVNMAHFEGLHEFTATLGTHYKPSNSRLVRAALATQAIECRGLFDRAEGAKRAYDDAVNARAEAFKGIPQLCTRLLKSFRASGATARTIEDAEGLNKKLQATRATPPPKAADGAEAAEARSVSQRSFDMVCVNFEKLVAFLAGKPAYAPAEPELQVAGLQARLDSMKAANTAVVPLEANLTGALLQRDIAFYAPETGLVDTALAVKEYIGSLDRKVVPAAAGVKAFRFRNLRGRLEKAGLA